MASRKIFFIFALCFCISCISGLDGQAAYVLIDHNSTNIKVIPQSAIEQAKSNLHIAYGHTSHGSQLTSGMSGLVSFANNGGLGLSLPKDIFLWNNGGSGGALDLHDYAMGGDVGYYPQWVNNTRTYLESSSNADVNVIIWSWCGQVGGKYSNGTLNSQYLIPMSELEAEYPDVKFVYMTGHVDIWDDADNKAANQVIRDYCQANNKILYDFEDIEHYDPAGDYFEFVDDACNYYDGPGGTELGNWAIEWQSSHTEGVDWYSCSSAHSEALNANRKAYAAWHLWAVLGGWNPSGQNAGVTITESGGGTAAVEGGSGDSYQVVLDTLPTDEVTITVTPDAQTNLGDGASIPIYLIFTADNWQTPQTVNVAAFDDTLIEGAHTSTITHVSASSDSDYSGLTIGDVTVNITDNDMPGVMITESGGSTIITEGGAGDSYQVVLNTQPAAEVSITVTPDSQTDLGHGAGTAFLLKFSTSNWNSPQVVSVAAHDDTLKEGRHTSTITHSAASSDSDYSAISITTVTAYIRDNESCMLLNIIPVIVGQQN